MASEVDAATNRVALADLSVFSKFEVAGADTLRFLDALGANAPPKPGRIGLTHALTPMGGIASEFAVSVFAADCAYLNSAAAAEEMDFDLLNARAKGFDITIRNRTDEMSVIGLMGPHSAEVLAALSAASPVLDIPWLSARQMDVAGVVARVLRVSYIGELGFELHVNRADAVKLFLALEQAGKRFGIGHYGTYARELDAA